jgi:hypothetical protein
MPIPFLPSNIRRNHALEHATLQILGENNPRLRLAGYSDSLGFWIIGKVDFDDLQEAIHQAHTRLNRGEAHLAIHPNCGTNLLTTGTLVSLASLFAGLGARKDALSRFSRTLTLVLPALIAGPMIGLQLQQYTTLAAVNDRWIKEIRPFDLGAIRGFRIVFE